MWNITVKRMRIIVKKMVCWQSIVTMWIGTKLFPRMGGMYVRQKRVSRFVVVVSPLLVWFRVPCPKRFNKTRMGVK